MEINKDSVLDLLYQKKNVLLMGAPGTGKSMIMNEVAEAFGAPNNTNAQPYLVHDSKIPIPAIHGINPILSKHNRKVFRTTMHQNSKYRDFFTGIIPKINANTGFSISEGILYKANEYAKKDDSAALLIIDELNRGPAIEVFGGSIVAIESDKRLSNDNRVLPTTQFFQILSPTNAQMEEYAFSPNLYILAAMNQADVSVAPLDVAFLRRWCTVKIHPDYKVLYNQFKVKEESSLPDEPSTVSDVYAVAIKALKKINEAIIIGRGEDYQLGQGVFLSTHPKDESMSSALIFIEQAWNMIYSHLEELFYGDCISIAFIVNANSKLSPYHTEEKNFAGEAKLILRHDDITEKNIYQLYLAITRLEI